MKVVNKLATREEYLRAAEKKPSERSKAEQALVDRGMNMQEVRNADFHARNRK